MGLFSRKVVKLNRRPYTAAVIPAAGSSSRMGGGDKLFVELLGIPVIAYTLLAFQICETVDEIVVVTSTDSILPIGDLCKEHGITKVRQVLCGGATRTDSVYVGLMNISPKTEYVAIHDGARPLVRPELIDLTVRCAYKHGAAVPIVPLNDTIKTMDGQIVVSTVDREALGAVQTPQVFEAGLIKGALTKAIAESWHLTDDASALERMNMRIQSVPGRHDNIKITTPGDAAVAEALMLARGGAYER